MIKSSAEVKCANEDDFLAQSIGKSRISCLKKDSYLSTTTIHDILYVLEAKTIYYLGRSSTNDK